MKTKRCSFILLMSLILILTGCQVGMNRVDSNPTTINIGYLRVPNDEMIALTEGYFEEAFKDTEIDLNFMVFDSGVDANQALVSGSIDFASMGHINGVVALAQGVEVELIWLHEILGDNEALVVRENSDINNLNDLVGKKIATPFASTSHYSLQQLLLEADLLDQVELLDMQTMDIVAAWERGDIDAAYTWEPTLSQIIQQNGKPLITSTEVAELGHKTANILLGRKAFTHHHPELTTKLIQSLVEGGNAYRKNPETMADKLASPLEITPEEVLLQMQGALWLTPEEEISHEYLGTSEQKGAFVQIFEESAQFLMDLDLISTLPTAQETSDFINPAYIERYLNTHQEVE